MGDLFHQTNANQTATNQQIGISSRDVGGSITTGAAGSVTSGSGIAAAAGSTVNVTSLDAAALHDSAALINNAIAANTDIAHSSMQAYQSALGVVAENQQATQAAISGQQSSLLGQLGINPSQLLWIGIAVVGGVILIGYLRKR